MFPKSDRAEHENAIALYDTFVIVAGRKEVIGEVGRMTVGEHGGVLSGGRILTHAKRDMQEKSLTGLSHLLSSAKADDPLTLRWVALSLARLCDPDRGAEQTKMNVLLLGPHLPVEVDQFDLVGSASL